MGQSPLNLMFVLDRMSINLTVLLMYNSGMAAINFVVVLDGKSVYLSVLVM